MNNEQAEQVELPAHHGNETDKHDAAHRMALLVAVGRSKKPLAKFVFCTTLIAVIACLLIPNRYTANTLLMPPQQMQSSAANAMAALAGITGGSLGGAKTIEQMYTEMLQSTTVRNAVIEKHQLKDVFGTSTQTATLKKLASKTIVSAERKSGFIRLSYTDEDPKRAANVANSYAEELQKLLNRLGVTEAQQRKLYFENQLAKIKNELAAAELEVHKTQSQSGLASIDAQTQAALTTVGELRAQILMSEIDISTKRAYSTDQHPDLKRALIELASKKALLAKLESGGTTLTGEKNFDAKSLEAVKSYRELKYQEALYALMAQQYYIAVADAARDASIVQQIDKATPPDLKSGPQRSLIVLTTFVLSLLAGVLYIAWHARALRRGDQVNWQTEIGYLRQAWLPNIQK